MRAYLIVDLGFGDGGKGLLTDFLVRRTRAGLVVRYNGGAQAGHNVVTPDGIHHTFSQFGAGSFVPGVRTLLSRHMVVHPAGLLTEGDILRQKGLTDIYSRLAVSGKALVVTPFHQAANRIRELLRGSGRHGSCGIGIGETVADSNAHPAEAVRAEDLLEATLLKEKLHAVRERKAAEIRNLLAGQARTARLEVERGIFDGEDAVSEMAERARRIAGLGVIHPDERIMDILRPAPTVIFEGAQGVLLDQDSGFHPYTTWSRCTSVNARALLREAAPGAEIQTMGVLRSHMVRHGPGPLPTETDALSPAVTDHNACGEWQGAVRYGWFDAVLARYALSVEGCADHLAITHLDAPGRLGFWKVCTDYDVDPASPSGGDIVAALRTGSIHREDLPALTQALTHVTPVLEPVPASEQAVAERISDLMGMEVSLRVCGPRSGDVTVTTPGL